MEGNPGRRLIAPRPRMSAVEALCQRGVARGAYTRSNSQGAFDANRRAWCSGTRCALWTMDLLVDDNDRDLGR